LAPGCELLGLLEIDLLEVVLNLLDHFDDAPQAQVAGARIELGANVVFRAIAVARRLLDRLFHRLDDDRLVDHLLGRNRSSRSQAVRRGWRKSHWPCSVFLFFENFFGAVISSGRVAAISLSVKTSLADWMSASGKETGRTCVVEQ
jgi:hypothetical protein